MPQMTDVVISDSVPTARTYQMVSPGSFGVRSDWVYKNGVVSTVFPRISALATRVDNQAQKLLLKFSMPSSYVDAATGLTKAGTTAWVEVRVTMPDAFPEALRNDFQAFTANMVNHTLIKAMIRDALPAT